MIRNCIAVVAGAVLYFLFSIGSLYLNAFLVFRNVGNLTDKDVIRLALWQTVVVGPAVVVIVGACVASLVERRRWWLAGVAFLPVLAYGLVTDVQNIGALEIFWFIAYVALACASGFVVSRFKQLRLT
jgi:hypothetical protein